MNRRHVRSRLRVFEPPLSFDDCPAGGKVSTFLRTALSTFVGASLLAMDVNDNACRVDERGALRSIASKLAPTVAPLSSLTDRH
ncbi:hypothetical protein C4K13_5810 [Pseudomonas chlororaphis subsp. aureofaciens]|nr:hypothetical protein C4K14_5990 [Pseudomonas chlororaphis subsp. aureofaciens]AZD95192.1 hypothetical protein C4K13_5810 [Pseudomonas chlororaphis subsp. aureofaciens]